MTQRRKTVYIASPYTNGDVATNVRNSLLMADKLLNMGYLPFPPLLSHFWHFLSPKSYDTWLDWGKEWVLHCDYVLRLPGQSEGADVEVELAKQHGIRVFYSLEELVLDSLY
jgi:hypothetical protein